MIHRLVDYALPRSAGPAVCLCGARSDNDLPSFIGRDYWFRQHRREVRRAEKLAAYIGKAS